MIATTDMNAPISLGENDKARPIAQTPTATKIEIIKTTSALCCLAQFFQLCGSALVTPLGGFFFCSSFMINLPSRLLYLSHLLMKGGENNVTTY